MLWCLDYLDLAAKTAICQIRIFMAMQQAPFQLKFASKFQGLQTYLYECDLHFG